MSIEIREPVEKAPWPPAPSNDRFYRYPKRHPVGNVQGESFFSIAKAQGLKPDDLVTYNFRTTNEKEINWYLANYVRCPAPRPGQSYYSFFGAAWDPQKKIGGEIFIPMFGEPQSNHLNRFGERVVDDYNKASLARKEPGGLCYAACYARVSQAGGNVGMAVPQWSDASIFGSLWGSLGAQPGWREAPEEYRGLGAPGAMVWARLATLVDMEGIWRGDLEPGAVIQVWKSASGFEGAKKGQTADGHSFIFLNYIHTGSAITGMAIADQGYQSGRPLVRGDYSVWIGANLLRAAQREPRRGPNP